MYAYVFKTRADPFAGRITMFRVVSGTLKSDATVHNVTRDAPERFGHVLAIQDTTSLRNDGQQHSINLHPTIAVDAQDGTLLGLVHAALLTRDERDWLDAYHARVLEEVGPLLPPDDLAWLRAASAPLVTVT